MSQSNLLYQTMNECDSCTAKSDHTSYKNTQSFIQNTSATKNMKHELKQIIAMEICNENSKNGKKWPVDFMLKESLKNGKYENHGLESWF